MLGRTPYIVDLPETVSPSSAARAVAHLPHLLWLDSAARHPSRGRYSFVTADPFRFRTQQVRIDRRDCFAELGEEWHRCRRPTIPGLPPFQGGVAGLFGYDLGSLIERLPQSRFNEFGIPDLAIGWYDWVLSWDHLLGQGRLISTGLPTPEDPNRAVRRAEEVLDLLHSEPPSLPTIIEPTIPIDNLAPMYPLPNRPHIFSNFSHSAYLQMIERGIEYIRAGDCFQVNLSQRLLTRTRRHPLELYFRLRECNAAPFAGYFDLGSAQLLSASPERFLRVQDGSVETRPIKGTRPVGRTPTEDDERRAELQHNPKDRAENVMIVDLLRNDLGRVCEFGTVRVPIVCEIETFRFVHHLVSEVRGVLRGDQSPFDLLRATFPGGSVTGAPKVRAMEIIAELEPTARGAYCGSLGYIGLDGTMDTNILIRTFTRRGGWLQFPVGGGIVADSEPSREYDETLHKAEGLLRSLPEGTGDDP